MRIASWNINSLRKRQDRLFAWLEATKPDIVCLQETKCPDEQFLALALEAASYHSAYHGEKSYNGVAILAKTDLRDVRPSLCDELPIRRRASLQPVLAAFGYSRSMQRMGKRSARRR